MCIEARAHSLILKHSQYLILEPGLDKSVFEPFSLSLARMSFMLKYISRKKSRLFVNFRREHL